MIKLLEHIYEENECHCDICISMCSENKPCWGLPEEIEKIIQVGFGNKLMIVYFLNKYQRPVQILAPALIGYESKVAPVIQKGRCTFLDSNNDCSLHKLNLKPLEGRIANCKNDRTQSLREDIANLWDNDFGKNLVAKWKKEQRGFESPYK